MEHVNTLKNEFIQIILIHFNDIYVNICIILEIDVLFYFTLLIFCSV